eukprot:TRINITY_DN3109_c0_g2_i4.p1 TRINITY_DN3109_c0_g2~~TRINITY_DN3109_c0_g2_i4.p1  ORF type:complete len:262 (-),score=36.95 TRINITY_DN3109_c0_g2_i4:205-990(-)
MTFPDEMQAFAENIFRNFPDVFFALGKCNSAGASRIQTSIVDRHGSRLVKILIPQEASRCFDDSIGADALLLADRLEKSADDSSHQHSVLEPSAPYSYLGRSAERCGVQPLRANMESMKSKVSWCPIDSTSTHRKSQGPGAREMHALDEAWSGRKISGFQGSLSEVGTEHWDAESARTSKRFVRSEASCVPLSSAWIDSKDETETVSRLGLAQRRGIGSIAHCVPLRCSEYGTSPDVAFLGPCQLEEDARALLGATNFAQA